MKEHFLAFGCTQYLRMKPNKERLKLVAFLPRSTGERNLWILVSLQKAIQRNIRQHFRSVFCSTLSIPFLPDRVSNNPVDVMVRGILPTVHNRRISRNFVC